jgi:hypothetical protein
VVSIEEGNEDGQEEGEREAMWRKHRRTDTDSAIAATISRDVFGIKDSR